MMAFLAAQDVSEAVTNEWQNAEQQTSVAREQLDAVYSQSIFNCQAGVTDETRTKYLRLLKVLASIKVSTV